MTYARIKRWSGGSMDSAGVDYEIDNLYNQLNNNAVDPTQFASINATFLTATSQASLTSSRTLTGTSGQVTLTDNGAASTEVISLPDPLNPPGVVNVPNTKLQAGGNQVLPILQIVAASTASATTTANTTYTSTNLAASITPKFNTSKIMIVVCGCLACSGAGIAYASVFRGSTDLCGTSGGFGLTGNNNCGVPMVVYDSPATTSSTTYTVKIRDNSGGTNAIFPSTDGGSFTSTATMLLIEIAQ